ncbi:MAG TPA: class GN sortase [Casimicrobiaceae bacterium]|nr:class GN sortase [Casimicrobiaceae bacterium]
MNHRLALSGAVVALLVVGGVTLASGTYLYGKAHVGQWLLHRAWARTQASGKPERPWPWADTQPIARLMAPRQRVDLLVLAGASGRTLAWGPGHLDGSADVGLPGNAVLSAHRDTHFRFLARAAIGDRLLVERADGHETAYRIREIAIVDVRALAMPRDTERPTLTLVTCYPFDALVPGGPLRYVVTAEADASPVHGPVRIVPTGATDLIASTPSRSVVRTRL